MSVYVSMCLFMSLCVCLLEMGRNLANTEVRPKNSAECSARQHVTIRPNFGKHLASFVAFHLRRFVLAAGVNESQ